MVSDDSDERRVRDSDTDPDDDGRTRTAEKNDDAPLESEPTVATEVDQRVVDLLSWILDTETRAKIYVYLLAHPASTSEEVAQGTGLYPSTVREALAELHEEDRVHREKRSSDGAGNNPYEYTAIQPSELVGGVVDQVQQELNTIFTLDRVLDRSHPEDEYDEDVDPVTIVVNETGIESDEGVSVESPADSASDPPESDDERTDDAAGEDPSSVDHDEDEEPAEGGSDSEDTAE